MLPLQGPSLVRELRASRLHGKAKKKSKLSMLISLFSVFRSNFQQFLSLKNSLPGRILSLLENWDWCIRFKNWSRMVGPVRPQRSLGGGRRCKGVPWWLRKESACQCGKCGFHPWVGKTPWRSKQQPTPVFLPGKFHGQRSLAGYSPRGCKEAHNWATTQQQEIQGFS